MKGGDIFRHGFQLVAIRVDGNEQWLYCFGVRPELFHHTGKIGKRRRADVRAISESKKDQKPFASVSLLRNSISALIGQREGRCKGDRRVLR